MTVSTAWGGAGRDYLSYALAIESIGRASATVATSLAVTNSLVAELIEHAGTDAQRDRWLRTLTRGETVGAFALSEAGAGTDAANQQTTATRVDGWFSPGRPEGLGRQRCRGRRDRRLCGDTAGAARQGSVGVSRGR